MTAEEFIDNARTLAMVETMFDDLEMDEDDVLEALLDHDFTEEEAQALIAEVQREK